MHQTFGEQGNHAGVAAKGTVTNDAAFAIAPEPYELHAYACRLGLASSNCHLGESGYIRLANHVICLALRIR